MWAFSFIVHGPVNLKNTATCTKHGGGGELIYFFLIELNSSFPLRKKQEDDQIKQASHKTEIWSLKYCPA